MQARERDGQVYIVGGFEHGFPEQDGAGSLFVDSRNKAGEMTGWTGIVLGLTCWDAVVLWLRC